MPESFDAYDYLGYISRRWLFITVACGVAAGLSLVVSLAIPKRYTATASIVIEPPGSNDVRTATAVSPVYLESLKSYERFAASDTLFAKAAEHFRLRDLQTQPIESLKRRVLKVAKLRDTKILEISASLPDPKMAQRLVQYLAEETVTLSRSESLAADREMIDEARRQLTQSQARLENTRAAETVSAAQEPVEALQAEVDAGANLVSKVREKLVTAEEESAEWEAREKFRSSSKLDDAALARQQMDAARARVAELELRASALQERVTKEGQALSRRTNRNRQLQVDLEQSETAFEAASNRLHDLQASAGAHGERLRVIDPGIVPERPTSPNVPLNLIAGALFALVASLAGLSLRFVYQRGRPLRLEEARARRAMLG